MTVSSIPDCARHHNHDQQKYLLTSETARKHDDEQFFERVISLSTALQPSWLLEHSLFTLCEQTSLLNHHAEAGGFWGRTMELFLL